MNSEYPDPALFDRRGSDDWDVDGGADIRVAAKARAAEILDRRWPAVIPPGFDRDLWGRFAIPLPEAETRPAPGLGARSAGT